MSSLLGEIEALVSPLFESDKQFELVDITYQKSQGGWALCFYIDKPGGISLDDCQSWSQKIGSLLEQEDPISHAYSLEVSSPGLNRPLKKLKDFERFKGQRIQTKLFAPLDGQKNFRGVLLGATDDQVEMELEDGRKVSLPRRQVAKSNLDPVIEI